MIGRIWRHAAVSLRVVLVLANLAAVTSLVEVIGISVDAGALVTVIGLLAALSTAALLAAVGCAVLPRGLVTRAEVVAAMVWGGLVATFCASLLNSLGPGVVIAPFVEEVLKVAGVVVVLRIFGVGTPIRGFVVGYLVGAAFECYENFLYIASPDDPYGSVAEAFAALPVRILLGFGLHAAATAMTGAAVAYTLGQSGRVLGRVSIGVLLLAIAIHLVWDLATVAGIAGYALMALDYAVLVALFLVTRKRALAASKRMSGGRPS